MPSLARAQSFATRSASRFRVGQYRSRSGTRLRRRSRLKEGAASATDYDRRGGWRPALRWSTSRAFSKSNLRKLGQTVDRFTPRFQHIETKLQQANKSFDQSPSQKWTGSGKKLKRSKCRRKARMSLGQPRIVFLDAATYGRHLINRFTDRWNCATHQVTTSDETPSGSRVDRSRSHKVVLDKTV